MSVFRIEKNKNYTVMSNHHLRNKELTLKSKGLLSLMLSLPEEWDYTLKGLSIICKEGIDAIRVSINELEKQGYIERRRNRNEKGQLTNTEYIIHEYPVSISPKSEKPTLEKPILDNPMQENPTLENPMQINKDKTNTKKLNTDVIKYPSINQTDSAVSMFATQTPPSASASKPQSGLSLRDWQQDCQQLGGTRLIDRYNQNAELIKSNIGYETLLHSYDKPLIDEIVSLMTEVLTIDTPYYTIEKKQYPTELVRQRFLEIDYGKLEAFMLDFTRRNEKIHNTKAYLITSLFNIAATAETKLSNMVRNDLYE